MARKTGEVRELVIGERFNRLTVVEFLGKDKNYKMKYKCLCDCGKTKEVDKYTLLKGTTLSCGCLQKERVAKSRFKDITGEKFGKLTVLYQSNHRGGNNRDIYWICQCSCKNKTIVEVMGTALRRNERSTKSCGCLDSTTHGMSGTKVYKAWDSMQQRCYNPNNSGYHRYGGRGIKVCSEWLHKEDGFNCFHKWSMANGFINSPDVSIDRINNNGDYEPSNCRWTNVITQANNREDNVVIEIDGINKTVAEWCRIYNIDYNVVNSRRINGWKEEDLFIPVRKYGGNI